MDLPKEDLSPLTAKEAYLLFPDVWLDDIRTEPKGWLRAETVAEAITFIEIGCNELSLDHDLGLDKQGEGKTGYDLCKWMASSDLWPEGDIFLHTSSPVGLTNMRETILRYGPYKPGASNRNLTRVT